MRYPAANSGTIAFAFRHFDAPRKIPARQCDINGFLAARWQCWHVQFRLF